MNFPLTLTFKFFTLGQQMRVMDASGALVCYVKQKAFKLKEDVIVFADEQQTRPIFNVKADRILDISARYTITAPDGRELGAIKREGMKSLWQTTYQIQDPAGNQIGRIREENPWIKIADALLSEIPLVGWIAQKFVNPAYLIEVPVGEPLLRAQKQPSFMERRFEIRQLGPVETQMEHVLIPAIMMMVLLERARG